METIQNSTHPLFKPNTLMRRLIGRVRVLIIALTVMIALLSASFAIGQSSEDFDLACRSILSAGGGTITAGNFGVQAALGMPIVPPQDSSVAPTYSVRSANFGVRAGFLPGYPTASQSAAVAATEAALTAPEQDDFVQHLPFLARVSRIVRGGC